MAGEVEALKAGARPASFMRRASPLLLALLVLAALPGLAAPAGLMPLPGPAAGLTASAAAAAGNSDWPLVKELAIAGLEIEGGSSDLRYLGCRALLALGEGPGAALPEIEAALSADRFALVSKEDALLLRAELLVDMRRYSEALAVLGPAREDPPVSLALSPDYRLLRAQAFYGLEEEAAARGELEAGLGRFPEDTRFARLFFEREAAPPSAEARRLGETILRRLPGLAAQDPELALLAVPFISDPAKRRDGILGFRASGNISTEAVLLALENGLSSPEAALGDFLRLGPRFRIADLERLREELRSKPEAREAERRLSEALASFTGSLEADRDGDGNAEEEADYQGGALMAWSLDPDQDGFEEIRLQFDSGIPVKAWTRAEGLEIETRYSAYPYIASLRIAESRSRPLLGTEPGEEGARNPPRTYYFGLEALSYRPLELIAFPASSSSFYLPRPSQADLPLEREALASALERRRALPEGEEILSLDRGIPRRLELLREGRLWSRLDYAKGLPDREILDMDGDGRFETERIYEAEYGQALLSSIRIDLDGDGAFDYREEQFAPFRKEWDYDGDGRPDAAESRGEDGWRLREFSTRLGGPLDERLLFDAEGLLISAQREGVELPLLPDRNPRLRWLGQKPFDLGSNLPAEEGVYRTMGIRYRLIYSGTEAFAEIIP